MGHREKSHSLPEKEMVPTEMTESFYAFFFCWWISESRQISTPESVSFRGSGSSPVDSTDSSSACQFPLWETLYFTYLVHWNITRNKRFHQGNKQKLTQTEHVIPWRIAPSCLWNDNMEFQCVIGLYYTAASWGVSVSATPAASELKLLRLTQGGNEAISQGAFVALLWRHPLAA